MEKTIGDGMDSQWRGGFVGVSHHSWALLFVGIFIFLLRSVCSHHGGGTLGLKVEQSPQPLGSPFQSPSFVPV